MKPKTKQRKKNYLGSFGKIAFYSTILLLILILTQAVLKDPNASFYIILIPALVVIGLTFTISLYGFIILTIYYQFKAKMIFWSIVSFLLLIINLADIYGNVGTSTGIILIISCVVYYFYYVKPKLKKKKKK